MSVKKFRGTMRDDRRLLVCPECGTATFKVVLRGASAIPVMECSNCECEMAGVKVDV